MNISGKRPSTTLNSTSNKQKPPKASKTIDSINQQTDYLYQKK